MVLYRQSTMPMTSTAPSQISQSNERPAQPNIPFSFIDFLRDHHASMTSVAKPTDEALAQSSGVITQPTTRTITAWSKGRIGLGLG